ncbi:MAG: Transketolase central region, partial [Parcubacteria group bacterium GW2011_GWA1_Parcubacteria_45_10]
NPKALLAKDIFKRGIEQVPTRNGYGEGLVAAGEKDENVMVLCADLTESTRSQLFKEKFPERFVEVGVAEQLLATLASGITPIQMIKAGAIIANGGRVVFPHLVRKLQKDGWGEEISSPLGEKVLSDEAVAGIKAMMVEAAKNGKPTYLRFAREKTPVFTTEVSPFKIGRAEIFWEAKDPKVAIIGCGPLVYEALLAAKALAKSKINSIVINCHTVKPIDEQVIIRAAKLAGAIITVEEHQVTGGLGGAVAEVLSRNFPTPQEFVGMPDHFGESGTPSERVIKRKSE